ncbi:MAG TPA: protein kinase [Methanospirillum sp.]|uniref:protein kinase domain-containing protein n=1 Tax=Methanospirillum sp. TaxID=45200 RepID=UPI002C5C5502|nr:protein kinase [Methanospirillum sp.]HWQ64359.1 protein kinase [Methanospirillum sp.]
MPQIPALVVLILFCLLVLAPPVMAQEEETSTYNVGFGFSYVKDTIPDRLIPGRSYPVMITFRNTGLVTWERKNHRMGMVYGGNLTEVVGMPSFVDIPEDSTIAPGNEITFAISVLPVGPPGEYFLPFYVAYRTAQGDQRVTEVWTKTISVVPADGVSSPMNGSISVDSAKQELSVLLKGQPMGYTPCIIPDLKPGSYAVTVRGDGNERTVSVQVEKSTMSRVFVGNITQEPTINFKKIDVVSNGTLFEYVKANVPLIVIVSAFLLGCIVLMIHTVRLRRERESEDKENLEKKGTKRTLDGASSLEEKDLLDDYHNRKHLFEQASSDPGSGSDAGQKIVDITVGPMKNVRKFSRDMLEKNRPEDAESGLGGSLVSSGNEENSSSLVGVKLNHLDVRPGSAVAHISALNHSPDPLSIEGLLIGPGTSAPLSVEVTEPVTDEYEMTLSLKILSQKGQEFYRYIRIPYNRGVALLARGVAEKAYEYFHLVFRNNPGQIDALIRQAEVLRRWGLEEEAEAMINQAISIDPDNEEALEMLKQLSAIKEKRAAEKKKNEEKPKIPGFPDLLSDRYTPIRLLGKDAFASIVLVLRNDTGDLRALKIAHEDAAPASSLFTEISVLYQLKHPNVLKMFRAEFNPSLFLELEYASGITCNDRLCRTLADLKHPVSEEIILVFIEQIAHGLAYLHQKGVRHYHLSPRHILLDEPMTPKISGIIRESKSRMGSGSVSPAYCLAPEQISREKYGKLGKRTDIFQFGAIWYWLMTGRSPYPNGSITPAGENGFVSGVYVSPSNNHPEYAKYDPLLRKLLTLEKKERYASVDEFIVELKQLMLHEGDPKENNGS